MMQKIIGVTELQRRFRLVFDEVAREHVPYVLTRGSRPEAALIPYEEFLQFQALKEQEVLARFDRLAARLAEQNASASEEEVAADVATSLEEVRSNRPNRRPAD
jgi:prevent-host-death family protein